MSTKIYNAFIFNNIFDFETLQLKIKEFQENLLPEIQNYFILDKLNKMINYYLNNLADDICSYFGLGCRNVSKIFVPKDFDLMSLKAGFSKHIEISQHNQYMNNLDYQRTLYLMNQVPLIDIDFVNIVENKSLHSPISCLHVERYETIDDVNNFIIDERENIQCIVGKDYLDFGKSQQPTLSDYADNVDTMKFILSI